MDGMPCFTCPACSATSYNENDITAGYCGRCHWYTGDPLLAWQRPELFTAHGATPPARPAAVSRYRVDQRVQHRDDTQYILGTITEVIDETHYRVRWDEGWDLYDDTELKPAPEGEA